MSKWGLALMSVGGVAIISSQVSGQTNWLTFIMGAALVLVGVIFVVKDKSRSKK